ncbi:MAG: glutamate--tRNA ligase [Coriobacteriia bacterium]|nr:glutamate--tRNA ligase [Coriobacteriia bacterium]MBN2822723.1 glutamate--tRNA ligase [Coriobacteriia bacterium]
MSENVRVRFAPSPTGHLHIGGARTAIYNWAFARRHGGTFILRIEDTDPERSTEENTQAILRAMEWLGMDYDEGPIVGGQYGPYFQTQRTASYSEALEELKRAGATYPCFCTPAELEVKRNAARSKGGFAGYDRTCRALSPSEAKARIAAGEPHVWRLKVPEDRGEIVFSDAVRGDVTFPADTVDDLVLVRTDGSATYNFAVTVDDATMAITHVIRGDDHLSNTPKQILIYEALGKSLPTFAHLSMILGSDGKRLSKRHGATSVEAYRDLGYIPEAVLNYLALLGWSLDGETTVFSRETLAENFALDRVSRNAAIFDEEKLEWLNGVYIRELPASGLVDRIVPWLEAEGLTDAADVAARRAWFEELAPLVSERIKRMDEVAGVVRFLFDDAISIAEDAREKVLMKEGAARSLEAAADVLSRLDVFDAASVEESLRTLPGSLELKPKVVFQAVRVAVTGSTVSPPLFESIALLGKERTLTRLHDALTSATH